jgi:hypothetical protein
VNVRRRTGSCGARSIARPISTARFLAAPRASVTLSSAQTRGLFRPKRQSALRRAICTGTFHSSGAEHVLSFEVREMESRRVAVLSVFVSSLIAIAGCGGGGGSVTPNPPGGNPAPGAGTPAPSGEPVAAAHIDTDRKADARIDTDREADGLAHADYRHGKLRARLSVIVHVQRDDVPVQNGWRESGARNDDDHSDGDRSGEADVC